MRENSVYGSEELLAAVEASPAAVAVHDKRAWVGLFAENGQVNDPVGSTPHVGARAIGRFYGTFIAPNAIEFNVEHDVVAGMSVLRDLTVCTTMPTGVSVYIPMHLRYDLVAEGDQGSLKIEKLFAHWELNLMVLQLLALGAGGVVAAAALGPQLVAKLGLSGALGFMKGLRGVGKAGKERVQDLAGAIARGDEYSTRALVAPGATFSPDGVAAVGLKEFMGMAQGFTVDKLIAAGRSVSATVRLGERRGVGLFEFSDNSGAAGTLSSARLYI